MFALHNEKMENMISISDGSGCHGRLDLVMFSSQNIIQFDYFTL